MAGEVESELERRVSREHSYCKIQSFKSRPSSVSLPTVVLFESQISCTREEGDSASDSSDEDEEDNDINVESVAMVPTLPYDERKVGLIMVECARHVNLVRLPPPPPPPPLAVEPGGLEVGGALERGLSDGSLQQRALLHSLVQVLQGDYLARLSCHHTCHEPIKRRLYCDKAARRFRKLLADINWDPSLTQWVHETLIQVLDSDLLPVYLDVLQVLKAKVPVLVEQMVHSSSDMVGGEAFGLLLKRPWNPVTGMQPVDKLVRFDLPPLFISLPYSSVGLGGRRWRLWQSQLSSFGKVFPIIVPEGVLDPAHATPISELAQHMLGSSLARVQELKTQFPGRPIVLLGFSIAGRLACKIAEVEPVAAILSLGLPSRGAWHVWQPESDPFKQCRCPTLFAVGSEGVLSSASYLEELRSEMSCCTGLVVVGGGDDQLRLSAAAQFEETVCQSIVDRCVMEQLYSFLLHVLPCSLPEEPRYCRKRKASHLEDIGSTFLTPAVAHGTITLSSTTDESARNYNFNNSNPTAAALKSLGQALKQGSRPPSASPSPHHFLAQQSRRQQHDGLPVMKRTLSVELPKIGRPRSRSTAVDKSRKQWEVRGRSKSSEQSSAQVGSFSPLPFLNMNSNCNSNNNNSCSGSVEDSPPQLLSLPQAQFRPLPITPPRNPFEDHLHHQLDPKTLKHLQLK